MTKLLTTNGIITKIKNLSNNTYHYWIKDQNGNEEKYIYFANNTSNIDGLDNSRKITIQYEIRYSDKYGQSNIIRDFTLFNLF